MHSLESADEAEGWERDIKTLVDKAIAREDEAEIRAAYGSRTLAYYRAKTLRFYDSNMCQYTVALMIIMAFVLDVSEAQLLPPPGSSLEQLFLVGAGGL